MVLLLASSRHPPISSATLTGGPRTVINLSIAWTSILDDTLIMDWASNFISNGVALAEARNLSHIYIYQNYAAASQDVFAGYNATNQAKLQAIHEKYDPTNVWTHLQPRVFQD